MEIDDDGDDDGGDGRPETSDDDSDPRGEEANAPSPRDEAGHDAAAIAALAQEGVEGSKSPICRKKVEAGLLKYVRSEECRRAICDEYFDNPKTTRRECSSGSA